MKKLAVSLVASVQYVPGTGKARYATGITITLAPLGTQVALAKFGGRYSPEEALKEFARNPGRFKLMPGAYDARALGVLPATVKLPERPVEAVAA